MGSNKDVQMVTCLGKHGPCSFYKSIKIGEQTLSLSQFFPVKIWPDSAILSIAEVQLLWTDKNENFCSLRLYFLPENTPEGRRSHHGEDEVIALHDKVIIRASDLSSWLVDESDWHWGFVIPQRPNDKPQKPISTLSKAFLSEKYRKNDKVRDTDDTRLDQLIVLNYVRYSRLRAVLKRLEGSNELSNWLSHPLVLALGGRNLGPNCRLLFAKEVFDYPELEDHELLCNHLAPKLKGRPRKTGRKRNPSLGSESNESETSSGGSRASRASDKSKKPPNGVWKPKFDLDKPRSPNNMHPRNIGNPLATELNSNGIKVEIDQAIKPEPTKRRSGRRKRTYSQLENENSPASSEGSGASGKTNEEEDIKDVPPTDANDNIDKSKSVPPRPSVITTQESIEHEYPRTKKMKTELNANVEVGQKAGSPPNSDSPVPRNAHQASNPIAIGVSTGSLTDAKTIPSSGIKYDGHYVDKKHAILPPKNSRSVSNKPSKPVKYGSSAKVEIEFNKPQYIPLKFASPSPFISTLYYSTPQIYGDPAFKKAPQQHQQPVLPTVRIEPVPKHPSIVSVQGAPSNGILDFSVRKDDTSNKGASPAAIHLNAKTNETLESGALNLTVKPGVGAGNNNIFHNLSDIPPCHAMNKLGVRLTSEVTIFPSALGQNALQQQMHIQQPHFTNAQQKSKRDRDATSSRSSSASIASRSPAHHLNAPQNCVPQMSQSSSQRSRNTLPNSAPPMQQSTAGRAGASNSMSSVQNSNPHVWRPMSASQSSSKSSFSIESQLPRSAPNQFGNKAPMPDPMHFARERTAPSSQHTSQSHRNSPLKVSQQLAALQQQERAAAAAVQQGREREAREKARELEKWSAAGFAPFLQAPSYYPKMDATAPYMPLLGSPFLLPPAGFMGLPPGAMEQFQLYKGLLLQQSLPPQFQPNWHPHLGNGGNPGGSNHSTKERK